MKKQLPHMINNHGFYLPFVLAVTAFVFAFLATFIYMYQNDLVINNLTLQQIEAETFIQMSRIEFINDEAKSNLSTVGEVYYTFPNGDVKIKYEQQTSSLWLLECWIEIDGYRNHIQTQYTLSLE